jgi:hypothetical protein
VDGSHHSQRIKKCPGGYQSWKGNGALRAAFTGMAAAIMNSHLKRTFISIVNHDDFKKVNAIYQLHERFQTPYALAGRTCIGLANKWARNLNSRVLDIEYVFEDEGQTRPV